MGIVVFVLPVLKALHPNAEIPLLLLQGFPISNKVVVFSPFEDLHSIPDLADNLLLLVQGQQLRLCYLLVETLNPFEVLHNESVIHDLVVNYLHFIRHPNVISRTPHWLVDNLEVGLQVPHQLLSHLVTTSGNRAEESVLVALDGGHQALLEAGETKKPEDQVFAFVQLVTKLDGVFDIFLLCTQLLVAKRS